MVLCAWAAELSIDAPLPRVAVHRLFRLRLGFASTGVGMRRSNDDLIALANQPPRPPLIEEIGRNSN
jgi:hypothetical protein